MQNGMSQLSMNTACDKDICDCERFYSVFLAQHGLVKPTPLPAPS